MRRLGTTDLDIIHLGVKNGGAINERDLESGLPGMGTGKVLDALASLRDRGMISLNSDGSFSLTEGATRTLWDRAVPLWARILGLLQTRSCTATQMAEYLLEPQEDVEREAESMREGGQVMVSPQRREGGVLRVYEILEDGRSRADRCDAAESVLGQMERRIREGADSGELLRLVGTLRESL